MYCNHCGSTVDEGMAFCPNCGKPFEMEPVNQSAVIPDYAQQPYAQQPYAQQPSYAMQPPVKPAKYLVWSIIVTAAASNVFGIPAIVNAARIFKCNARGDYEGARVYAKKSKTWSIVAGILDILFWILFIVGYSYLIVAAISSGEVLPTV